MKRKAIRRKKAVAIKKSESKERQVARRRAARMVQRLRRAAEASGELTASAIAREVAAVRRKRASHR